MTPRLSALVVARDEEAHLPDCLARLTFADEIVVVLDRCADGSKAVAESFGARVVEGAWPREGPRRHAGIAACRGAWILEIDADERVGDALAREIRATIQAGDADWFQVPIRNHIGGRLVRHGWGAYNGVNSKPILFRRDAKIWGRERVHPRIALRGQGGRLEAGLDHFVDENISAMLARLDRYTTARAADLRESGDIGRLSPNLRRLITRFWKVYVGRRGYREREYGLLLGLFAALYPLLSYLKARTEDD